MMNKLLMSYLLIGLFSFGATEADKHETVADTAAKSERETNGFADYDTLASKLEAWAKLNTLNDRTDMVTQDKNTLTLLLSKSEMEDAAKLLRRIKWYRSEIVKCENVDSSSKNLGKVLDECLAPGMLTESTRNAKADDSDTSFFLTFSSSELITCQTRLSDYFTEKLDSKNNSDASKFVADKEISEKLTTLFKLFTAKNDLKAPEKIATDLKDSLKAVSIENRCDVGSKKVTLNSEINKPEAVIPKSPPAVKPIQNPPTSLVQKQPEIKNQVSAVDPGQGGYVAPQGGYVAPQGGYVAPQGGYVAPQGGYKYNPSQYQRQNYNYNESDNDYGNGINPALYMMMQGYDKNDNDQNYNHQRPMPYYPQRQVDVGVRTQPNPYPIQYPRQIQQPPMYPPMFFPSIPSVPPPIIVSGGEGGSCFSCGSSGGGYVPQPNPQPLPSSPCLGGICQPLPCLSGQCMNRPPQIPNTCLPINQGYVGLGVGNLNCPVRMPQNGIPNIGQPPVTNYPMPYNPIPYNPNPNNPIPYNPIPYNPNVSPGYQTQYNQVPVTPNRNRIPRGIARRKK